MTEDYEVIGTARPETDRRCEGHGEKAGQCEEMAQAGWGGRLCYECNSRRRADLMRARLYPELAAKEAPAKPLPARQGSRQASPQAAPIPQPAGGRTPEQPPFKAKSRSRSRRRRPAVAAA